MKGGGGGGGGGGLQVQRELVAEHPRVAIGSAQACIHFEPRRISTWLTTLAGTEKYPYIQHLLEFERRGSMEQVPAWLREVATTLRLQEWRKELRDYPDTTFKNYILNGIEHGFRIGFNRAISHRPASSNMGNESSAGVTTW